MNKFNTEKAIKEKKKVVSHCTNLECQKEQLLILISKLYTISSSRMNVLPEEEQEHNVLSKCLINTSSYLFSIGDQLSKAQLNRKKIEEEITEAKKQIKNFDSILMREELD